ncbi:MAG: hypothetical protein WHT06_15890 [Desulfobacterales bacterium]
MIKYRNLDNSLKDLIVTTIPAGVKNDLLADVRQWNNAGGAFADNGGIQKIHVLNGATGAVAITGFTPSKVGQRVALVCSAANQSVTVKCGTGCTFDGTNNTATFGANKALDLIAISLTRWLVITNVGSVAFSTT